MADQRFTRPELERILEPAPRRAVLELALSLVLFFAATFAVVACLAELAQVRDDLRVIRSHVDVPASHNK